MTFPERRKGLGNREFVERLAIISLFVILLAALWALRHLLAVALGAVVIGVLIRAIADPLMRLPGVGKRGSAMLAVLLIAVLLGGFGWLFGREVASQFAELGSDVPQAWAAVKQQMTSLPMGDEIIVSVEAAISDGQGMVTRVAQLLLMAGNAVTTLFLIVFGAIFFATQPDLYRAGLLKLVPEEKRAVFGRALDDVGRALKLWLLGQLISMVLVGILTGLGLWWAGVSSPVALGLIAGLTEGIPYIGPIVAAIPGLLLALIQGPTTVLWALLVYVLVQQAEGNTVVPVIQRQTVFLPPALTLFALIAGGTLFGLIGLIFAAPMLVIVYVLTKRLYVREALDTPTKIPGEDQ